MLDRQSREMNKLAIKSLYFYTAGSRYNDSRFSDNLYSDTNLVSEFSSHTNTHRLPILNISTRIVLNIAITGENYAAKKYYERTEKSSTDVVPWTVD